jgi:iron(III) transport system substrate-binding protein
MAAAITALAGLGAPSAFAAQKSGDRCTKIGQTSGGLVCVNEAKAGQRPKLRWAVVPKPTTTVAATTAATAPATTAPVTLTVYSGRTYGIEPVYESFTKDTGIKLEIISASDTANRDRLRAEGARTPADVYLTTDVGALTIATQQGLLSPVSSPVLEKAVPIGLQDAKNHWFALSKRARVLFVNTKAVSAADQPKTYEDLGADRWSGRLCLRPASHVYTQSLAANMIAVNGVQKASGILKRIASNAKSENFIDSDTRILETLNAGGCEAAIANTYYFGRLGAKAPNVKMIFPNQADRGAHVNISGAGIVAASGDKVAAQRFIEWLATTGQAEYAGTNFEFTVNPDVPNRPEVAAFGIFRADEGRIDDYSTLQPSAAIVLADAGWR